MKIELLGWSSRGLRCPDIDVELTQHGKVLPVSLIQMPNGTGKTTTLELLMADPQVSDILVNSYRQVYVERQGRLELTNVSFTDEKHLLRPVDAVAAFSAVPADYVRTASRNPVYRALLPRPVHAERALFPGVVTIILAGIGIWRPITATRAAFAIAGLVAFDGSLGLHGILYRTLYWIFPPLHSVRVPARFDMLVVLTLAMLAGVGAARLIARLETTTARRNISTLCLSPP